MTNIYNRHYFDIEIEKKFNEVQRSGNHLSLILFDIDHFKLINDKYGHIIGDDSLIFLSNLIKNHIRIYDTFCRWGGEEFMIITQNSLEETIKIAEHLRKIVDDETKNEDKVPHFSCSFGIVTLNEFDNIRDAINKVDKLLYKSKENGRNMVSY